MASSQQQPMLKQTQSSSSGRDITRVPSSGSNRTRQQQSEKGGGDKETTDQQHETQLKSIQEDLDRKQSNYINREREYRGRIEALEQELQGKSSKDVPADQLAAAHMDRLRKLHSNIQGNVEHVQEQTARILQEQERDLLRAFRARLFDVQTELEKERANAQDGAAVWIEKNRQLEKELEWAKELADRLDRHNQALNQENSRLKGQFKTQEDDREYLIRQLVAAKKDNARLRQELGSASSEIDTLKQELEHTNATLRRFQREHTNEQTPEQNQHVSARHVMTAEEEERYKETIDKYRRMLEQEKRNLSTVRKQYANELSNKTELEKFFRQCVEDVRRQIAKRKRQAMRGRTQGTQLPDDDEDELTEEEIQEIDNEDFTAKDREAVLSQLLTHDTLLSDLHRRIFPPSGEYSSSPPRRAGGGHSHGSSPAGGEVGQTKQGVLSSPIMSAIRKAQRDEERAELLGRGYTNGDNNHNGSSSGRRIDHSDFVSDQRSQQMLQLREQDTHLDALESSLSRISELSKHIGHEVEEQSRLIEETQEDVEATQSKLEDTTKRINKFIEENGGPHWCCVVLVLSVVAFILFLLVLFT